MIINEITLIFYRYVINIPHGKKYSFAICVLCTVSVFDFTRQYINRNGRPISKMGPCRFSTSYLQNVCM